MSEAHARRLVYGRSQGLCEICGARPGTNWHHRRSAGRIWTAENGLHLCGSGTTGCHGWVTVHPEVSRELGWSVSNYLRPEEVAGVPVLRRGGWVQLTDQGGLLVLSWSVRPPPEWVPPFVSLHLPRR